MSELAKSGPNVVVTGMGIVSPFGIGADALWEGLAAKRSGVSRVERLAYTAAPDNMAGELKNFGEKDVKKLFPKRQRKFARVMCREIQLGVVSAILAIKDASLPLGENGVELEGLDHERFGVDFGANLMCSPPADLQAAAWACTHDDDATHTFHFDEWGDQGLSSMEPLWLLKYLPNMPGCHIGIIADARGPNNSITIDEASGNLAVGEGMRVIQRGRADIMIVGTTGTRLHPVKSLHAALWDKLADSPADPEKRSRPFDLDRTGQVLAEGAGSFILEEEVHARNRGADIMGTILGFGSSCVVKRGGSPQWTRALVNAMRVALADARIEAGDIGHVNAHGLGSVVSDREEAKAILEVFGDFGRQVPVTALKSYIGNCGSGCGPVELAGSLLGLKHGVILPTLNYDTPDPDCPLNVVHGEALPTDNKLFLKINITRMAQASAVVVAGV